MARQQETAAPAEPDHAGGILARLVAASPEVEGIEQLGSLDEDGEPEWFGVEIRLAGGRRLAVDAREL